MDCLDWITVKGFRSLRDVERLPLSRINLLIGANGSGKSNFLSAFTLLRALRVGMFQKFVAERGGADRLLFFGRERTEEIELWVSFRDERDQYSVTLTPTDQDGMIVDSEYAGFWDKSKGYSEPYMQSMKSLFRLGKEAAIGSSEPKGIPSYVRDRLGEFRAFHFHDTSADSPLRRTADVEDNRFLRHQGENLPAFLYYLKEKHAASYKLVLGAVRKIAPFLADFDLAPSRLNEATIRLEWRHRDSDGPFDVSALSDGTLRFIALATLLLQPASERPQTIIVDEPELGLHPDAIVLLASMMKHAAVETQLIVATQSPALISHFEPEDVIVADLVDGATQLRRLSAEPLAEWLERYSLGELWENNDLGGRPLAGAV